MNILSKNAPLEVSILKMETILSDLGCGITFATEKHPLKNCYSVNLTSIEAPNHIYSNGKGTLSGASKASALGEYIERLQTNNCFIDFHLPNRAYYPDQKVFEFGGEYLSPSLYTIYNPSNELSNEDLVDFNSDYTDKIVALPFQSFFANEHVYIPLNILSNLYVSNGLASGNTPDEAKVQALSEIFERYAKMEIIKNGYALPKYPEAIIATFPKLHADLIELRKAGFIVEVLDASLGGKFPVTAISLINPRNGTLFVSFGAHPILEVSLERTMSELMQGRGVENLDAFEMPTFDMSIVGDTFNLEAHFIDSNGKIGFGFLNASKMFEYAPWKYKDEGSAAEYAFLCNIVKSMGKEIYLREYTYLDFYSCHMIVPSVSEVYPIDDMVYQNRNSGKFIRHAVLNFKEENHEVLLETIEPLEDSLNMEKYIGVIFEQNFQMIDLKAQVNLLLENYEEAHMLLGFSQNPMSKLLCEILSLRGQNLIWSEYESALWDIFGKENVEHAVNILDGKVYFIDVSLHQHYVNILDMYDRLEIKKASIVA
ncbi:YcaO-like family protein [Sulfurospirillum diekertiae]|uniref:Ribosomal protein S12 methylthiotransferase accessory factor YcaO n=1 Tax=Sulfurospirillum diekertiae TaxID=1854492 RepID=A0A1Y0HI49_9BACT|nr:YcaO-like family protein [Sulfurospirillum diekertiae]ARU47748.1 Ribosomal protein S12 methylthiotransferase accessory factor YcaO [Sulfurospirillum diekertiae]ASC92594.1 Ribosomal protein S12 methylthiotransferase accessory factor YcaO [Sulfurospirillum diekertiae]